MNTNIYLREDTIFPGDWLEGRCQWFPEPNDRNKKAILTVGWRTEGRGNVDQKVIQELAIQPEESTSFRCQIPCDAPCSYDGELIRIIWEVKVEIKGRFKSKSTSEIFQVVPPKKND
jgi:hypothetical protein